MAKSKLPLAELLAQVAADVRTANAMARAAEGGPVMKFAECELELAVDAETTGDGKVELWVVSLGGGHTRSESHTIKIKYTADQNNPQGAVGALPHPRSNRRRVPKSGVGSEYPNNGTAPGRSSIRVAQRELECTHTNAQSAVGCRR